MSDADDIRFMLRALSLARAQLGRVAPNPAVGCMIVRDGEEIAHGATGDGGRPHAEEVALASLGGRADGATAYVTLEPCAERSNGTDSCSKRLAAAGVARVVIATENAHEKTAGAGLEALRAQGIALKFGICAGQARELNAGFFSLIETGRPLLIIGGDGKTCDAPFALEGGESALDALTRLGAAGMTRVWASADDSAALALAESGAVRTARA